MAANLNRSEEVDSAVKAKHELVQNSESQSDKAILVEISVPPVVKSNLEVA